MGARRGWRTVAEVDERGRAQELARLAAALAGGAGVSLPDSLALWRLAGGRPAAPPQRAADPGQELGEELERRLDERERRRGAHFTPAHVADRVVAMAIERPGTVVDPACGGGAMLLAAGRRLVDLGARREEVARRLLWGADLDPLASAVTEAAITLWAGTPPAPGHVVAGDTLLDGGAAWPHPPEGGFDVVVGNPPFQGQLGRTTARSADEAARLAERFGPAVSAYVDTAALFLLAAVDLARVGGRLALVQPQSTVASRDAGGVRAALAERARLVDLWAPSERMFAANVHICVPALDVGPGEPEDVGRWTDQLAAARGVPAVDLPAQTTIGDVATLVAGFRDEYYGLVPHVREAAGEPAAPLVTSGLIDVGIARWGERPVRFAKQAWARPEIDVAALAAADAGLAAWVARVRRPKVVVASQTRVIEAAGDLAGTWVPSTPVVSVLPHDAGAVPRLVALLCSPPVSAWAARRAAGTALSADAFRTSARLLAAVPLPLDDDAWAAATAALHERDRVEYAEAATAMFRLPAAQHDGAVAWWCERAKPTWPPPDQVR
jgi:hypothetical protein